MDRREFIKSAAFTAAAQTLTASPQTGIPETAGHTLLCEFQQNR
jgi:hypothetical protein